MKEKKIFKNYICISHFNEGHVYYIDNIMN